jgi:serine/threonine protein kinase
MQIISSPLLYHSELTWPTLSEASILPKPPSVIPSDPTSATIAGGEVENMLDLEAARVATAFGEVRLAELRLPPSATKNVAAKCLKESDDDEVSEKFIVEARTLCALRHPNIVRLVGVCIDQRPYLMLVEYLQHGDYLRVLRSKVATGNSSSSKITTASSLTLLSLLSSICQIADAMAYLEKLRIIHRDLAAR